MARYAVLLRRLLTDRASPRVVMGSASRAGSRHLCSSSDSVSAPDRKTLPRDSHVLVPRTRDYVALRDKRDFIDVVKFGTLRWRDDPGGPNAITKSV